MYYKIELLKRKKWYWRMVAKANKQIILTSETYASKWNAKRIAQKMAAVNNFEYKEVK